LQPAQYASNKFIAKRAESLYAQPHPHRVAQPSPKNQAECSENAGPSGSDFGLGEALAWQLSSRAHGTHAEQPGGDSHSFWGPTIHTPDPSPDPQTTR